MIKKRKTVLLFLAACVLFGILYATTYIPRKLITIDPASISKIEIFDGTRGESRTITAAEDLDHIIANLNGSPSRKENAALDTRDTDSA